MTFELDQARAGIVIEGDLIVVARVLVCDLEYDLAAIRAIPHLNTSGQTDGLRLSAIGHGHPMELLGFRNGDVLLGEPTEGVSRLVDAWRSETSVSVALSRRSAPIQLNYRLEGAPCPASGAEVR